MNNRVGDGICNDEKQTVRDLELKWESYGELKLKWKSWKTLQYWTCFGNSAITWDVDIRSRLFMNRLKEDSEGYNPYVYHFSRIEHYRASKSSSSHYYEFQGRTNNAAAQCRGTTAILIQIMTRFHCFKCFKLIRKGGNVTLRP